MPPLVLLLLLLVLIVLATGGGVWYGPQRGPVAWSPLGVVLVVLLVLVLLGRVRLG